MSQYPRGKGGQALALRRCWNGELTDVRLEVLHAMATEAYGGEGRHPGGTNNIMKFLISLTRGCSANFCNSHVINVFSFVAHRGSGVVLRSIITQNH